MSDSAPSITLFHHPECSASRAALSLIRDAGHEPRIVEYLQHPLTKDELAALVAATGEPVRALLRAMEPLVAELALDDEATSTDDDLLDAMAAHPVLMNRPVVVTPRGAKLCRPPESVLALLPARAGD